MIALRAVGKLGAPHVRPRPLKGTDGCSESHAGFVSGLPLYTSSGAAAGTRASTWPRKIRQIEVLQYIFVLVLHTRS